MRKSVHAAFLCIMAGLLAIAYGCQSNSSATAPAATADPSLVWSINVEKSELTNSVASTEGFVEYGGDVNEVSFRDDASEGNTYLFVLLSIDKSQPGKEKFLWSELTVVDSNGVSYSRLANDTFLELHGLPRIKSSDLSIGNNYGYICFEVPDSVAANELTLTYSAGDSIQSIALRPTVIKP